MFLEPYVEYGRILGFPKLCATPKIAELGATGPYILLRRVFLSL